MSFIMDILGMAFLIVGVALTITGFSQAEATRVGQYFTDSYFYMGCAGLVLVYLSPMITLAPLFWKATQ